MATTFKYLVSLIFLAFVIKVFDLIFLSRIMWPNVSVEQPSNCPKKHWASSSWQASMEGGGYQQLHL
ncbi:transmembrane protein, putative [Medicago truncatula]|uniref:Transmembrane protein, putative n=1 Tax=Medicago truncatula TaxID=3880 RepID=A0A072VIP4_MEDTR|nr:transmembrane protein, putative [Medicago truncatula]